MSAKLCNRMSKGPRIIQNEKIIHEKHVKATDVIGESLLAIVSYLMNEIFLMCHAIINCNVYCRTFNSKQVELKIKFMQQTTPLRHCSGDLCIPAPYCTHVPDFGEICSNFQPVANGQWS